jgi:hypothetical protein
MTNRTNPADLGSNYEPLRRFGDWVRVPAIETRTGGVYGQTSVPQVTPAAEKGKTATASESGRFPSSAGRGLDCGAELLEDGSSVGSICTRSPPRGQSTLILLSYVFRIFFN